ncbi:LysR substrate-binding domain-containing protein [Nocardia sp. 2TAF39]|uniref:LysR substrate-binding domain-containing protein n=1 Tax=unclassified Nocardia TaxID=2637762 RepID=UPI003F98E204
MLPDRPDYSRQPLRREPFVAVVNTHHRLAERIAVALRELAGQTFCFYSRDLAAAHYDKLTALLELTGKTFPRKEEPARPASSQSRSH